MIHIYVLSYEGKKKCAIPERVARMNWYGTLAKSWGISESRQLRKLIPRNSSLSPGESCTLSRNVYGTSQVLYEPLYKFPSSQRPLLYHTPQLLLVLTYRIRPCMGLIFSLAHRLVSHRGMVVLFLFPCCFLSCYC